MAWFNNRYTCERCNRSWQSGWSCTCDEDCPFCGARHVTPTESEDVTEIIKRDQASFVVLRSPNEAEHDPAYEEIDRFESSEAAMAYLAGLQRARSRV